MSTLFGTLWAMPGAGSGAAFVDGLAYNQTETIDNTGFIFDITGVSRPVQVAIDCGTGDVLEMLTTTDPAGLLDDAHPSWQVASAASSFDRIETVYSAGIVGILVRRTVGSSSDSKAWVYAPFRGAEYNPVYDPNYDVAFADLTDVQRFMRQASFGEFPGEAQALLTSGDTAGEVFDVLYNGSYRYMGGAFPATAGTFPAIAEGASAGDNVGRRSLAASWMYRSLIWRHGPDPFRGRLVAAWNKMVCVGPILSETSSRAYERTQNDLLDLLDGTLQDYVRWLAYARYVQWFLDNINNQGRTANNSADQEPNQNFVREKLQLFTLGQWQKNKDGSFKLDGNGERIPTYEYEDVLNMARLYSDFQLDGTAASLVARTTRHYRGAVLMPSAGISRAAYPGEPTAGTKFVKGVNIYGMVEEVCDWIYNHDTFLVYFAEHFIHELVNENPSPQYVRRVVAALEDDGNGVRGNIRAMFRAILLDPEARGTVSSKNPNTYGRALDMHLQVAAAWRLAQQREIAEFGYTASASVVNGSTTMTIAAGDNLPLEAWTGSWRVAGPGLPGTARATWATATTLTLNAAYTGTTGTYTFEFARPLNEVMIDCIESSQALDNTSATNNAAGRTPAEWGFAATVFGDYPFDYEAEPGFLARTTAMWTPGAILALWHTLIRFSIYHSKNGIYGGVLARRMGVWDLDYMIAGTPTNADLIDRAVAVILYGRTLPSAARSKLIEALDTMMTDSATNYGAPDNATKLDRRASMAIGLVSMMPQALEQI